MTIELAVPRPNLFDPKPDINLVFRENNQFVNKSSIELFRKKRIVLFGLPGAFTPTCSAYQLPGFEEKYDEIISLGVDEIYCTSVNDSFVMNAWAKDLGITKVKMIPDGNGDLASYFRYLTPRFSLGFGARSWRYAMVLNNRNVEWIGLEPGIEHPESSEDPYQESTPEKVLEYLKSV